MTLDDILNDKEFASLLEVSEEQQKLNDSLFNGPFAKPSKMSLGESMAILGSGEKVAIGK